MMSAVQMKVWSAGVDGLHSQRSEMASRGDCSKHGQAEMEQHHSIRTGILLKTAVYARISEENLKWEKLSNCGKFIKVQQNLAPCRSVQ
jgi:hypothetical protein